MTRYFFILLLTLCLNADLIAQNPSGQIRVIKGNQVEFNFNSYGKLRDGISYTDFTRVEVSVNDIDFPFITGWRLRVRANTLDFFSDYNSNPTKPVLNILTFSTTGTKVTGSTDVPLNYFPPNNGVIIASCSGGDFVINDTYTIDITYKCAMNDELFGYLSDTYTVDLEFILETIDP